jgi:hypothetical protein
MLDEFSDVVSVYQPVRLSERSVSMAIELEEMSKPAAKPALRLPPAEMNELKSSQFFCCKGDWLDRA